MVNFTFIEQENLERPLEAQWEIVKIFFGIAFTATSTMGIVTNTINIYVFFKMGVDDGVTLSFQILSMSDLSFVSARLMLGVALCLGVMEDNNFFKLYIDPFSVNMFAVNVGHAINLLSTLITAYLAVARCMCIVKPLHFKSDFSRKRSGIVLIIFALFSLAYFIPVFAGMGMVEHFDQATNTFRLVFWLADFRAEVYDVVETMTDLFIPIFAQIIIVICVLVMAKALHRAHQFRQSLSAENSKQFRQFVATEKSMQFRQTVAAEKSKQFRLSVARAAETSKAQGTKGFSGNQSGKGGGTLDSNKSRLTGKDLQVVHQVVLICTVLIISNIPKIVTALYGIVDPEFAINDKLEYVYLTCKNVRITSDIINASVNIFIYLKYNSKFRQLCPCV